MKKFTKVFVGICLIILVALSATACSLKKDAEGRFMLNAPKVTIENDIVSWVVVGNGKKYYDKFDIKIDDRIIEGVSGNQYSLAEVDGGKTVSVQVRAAGDNVKTVSSPFSDAVSYKAPLRLAAPKAISVAEVDGGLKITWDKVENAETYDIQQIESVNGGTQWYRNVADTSFVVATSNISATGKYHYKVQAKNSSKDFMDSSLSIVQAIYTKSEKLAAPAPELNSSSITWSEVPSATNYTISFAKVTESYDDSNINEIVQKYKEHAIDVITVSQSSRSYTNTQVTEALKTYKTKWDAANSGDLDIAGKYVIYIKAIHSKYSDVYLDSDMAAVTKIYDKDSESESKKPIIFSKPGLASDIKITDDKVGEEGNQTDAKVLHWQKVEEFNKYTLRFYSNGARAFETNVDENSDNLTSRFENNEVQRGKIFEIAIAVRGDFENGVLSGEESYYGEGDNHSTYSYIPSELKLVGGEGEYKDYYKIDNLGDFQYMLQNASAGNKYYLTKDIDGGSSSVNCNFLAGTGDFVGIFDGGNRVISNINFVVNGNSQSINLFNKISNTAEINSEFKNVTFSNITIKTENNNIQNVALIANENNGIIQNVYLISSSFETMCTTAGLVISNFGEINGCGFMNTTIQATGYVEDEEEEKTTVTEGRAINSAAIAINNNGIIFNASIFKAKVNAVSRLANVKAGGVAVFNNGTNSKITNSFVRNSYINSDTIIGSNAVSAISGGIVAQNEGTVSECYVTHESSESTAVQSNSGILSGATAVRDSVAGGIIGEMSNGNINHCYVSSARIYSNTRASGMVGRKTNSNAITIQNSYVFRIRLNASDRAMVLTDTEGVTCNNVYAVKMDISKDANFNNITADKQIERGDLIGTEIDGFAVFKEDYAEQPILKNMLYVRPGGYEVEYSKNANRNLVVYAMLGNGKDNQVVCNIDDAWKSDLTKTGKKVDIYTVTLGEGDSALKLVLPIHVTVK